MSLSKKIFIISTAILVPLLFFLGIYNFAFKEQSQSSDAELATEKKVTEEKKTEESSFFDFSSDKGSKKQGKIYAISETPSLAPFLKDKDGRVVFYAKENGNAFAVDLDGGNRKIVSSDNLSGLKDVIWSPDGEKVISIISKDGKDTFYSYSHQLGAGSKLKDGLDNANWTNLGDKIIYKYFDATTRKRTLNIADPDGSNWKTLADAEFRSVQLAQIPQTSFISFWNQANSYEETKLQSISMVGGEKKTIFSGKFGADYLWSPSGERALVSYVDKKGGSKMMLGVMNKNGGEFHDLGIPTLTSKCVWASDNATVYCAWMAGIPETAIMPNEYQEKKLLTKDTFWKVNVISGAKDRLVETSDIEGVYDASDLMLSSQQVLLFLNRQDNKIYRLDL